MANENRQIVLRKRLIYAGDLWHKTFDCEEPGDFRKAIENAPTVYAVEVEYPDLLKAIELLIKQYDHSKASEYVHNPVAHALYYTWKQVDERR